MSSFKIQLTDKMETKFKVLEEAGDAILHIVKAFSFFRTDNSVLNQFLCEIESLVETHRCRRAPGIECKENRGDSNPAKNQSDIKVPVPVAVQVPVDSHGPIAEGTNALIGFGNVDCCKEVQASQEKGCTIKLNCSNDDQSAEEQVFDNDFLLEYILLRLPISDLKTCRCVSPTWNISATKLLLRQTSLVSPNLNSPATQNFLSSFGYQIKTLHLKVNNNCSDSTDSADIDSSNIFPTNSCSQFVSLKNLKDLLTHQVPNVEQLVLGSFPVLWGNDDDLSQLFPEPVMPDEAASAVIDSSEPLAKLKSLHFLNPAPVKICDDLLRTAKNLENIGLSVGCDSLITYLMESNKVHLLKTLEVELDDDNTELYDTFSESEDILNLKKFAISIPMEDPEEWLDIVRIIVNILKTSSSTLEEFHSQPLADLFGFEFPPLPQLRKVKILNSIMVYGKFFTDDLKLSEAFPLLESLESEVEYDLKMYLNFEWDWDTIFGATSEDVHEKVRELNFTCGPPASWLENFSSMFPNLKTVKIGFIDDFSRASQALWTLSRLTELEFGIEIKDKDKDLEDKNGYPALDAGFTGFSEEMCLQLYDTSREVNLGGLETLRENPSLLDAICLRTLNIKFHDELAGERDGETFRILSHVTGLFAFRMCSELHVTITISAVELENLKILKNAVSPILPYVDSVTSSADN